MRPAPGGPTRCLEVGKILRIDPRGHNSANGQYGIPADNPFVGQNDIEEVDVVRPGQHYGGSSKEGTFTFDNNGAGAGFVTADSPACRLG